jgi:hypothetical protein
MIAAESSFGAAYDALAEQSDRRRTGFVGSGTDLAQATPGPGHWDVVYRAHLVNGRLPAVARVDRDRHNGAPSGGYCRWWWASRS